MPNTEKTLEFKFERTIPAPPTRVFDAWLDPKIPGNPWNLAEKLLLDPKVDGMFFWSHGTNGHYGRFTEMERPARIQCTWVSPNTLGRESKVTVSFEPKGDDTRLVLVHSELPDHELARSHEKGWAYFLGLLTGQLGEVK